MFPNTDKPLLQIPEAEEDILEGLDDDEVNSYYCIRMMQTFFPCMYHILKESVSHTPHYKCKHIVVSS